MKYLIMSDIHGNLDALESCLVRARGIGFDRLVCLGDFVGYGPNPNEVCDWASDYLSNHPDTIFVYGNHDIAIRDNSFDLSSYNSAAISAIISQRKVLTDSSRRFLLSLRESVIDSGIEFVHGSPVIWDNYIYDRYDAMGAIRHMSQGLCFVGHTHCPAVWDDSDSTSCSGTLMMGNRIVNVGSVGQPRDGNPDACFAVCDVSSLGKAVHFIRVSYDVSLVQEKMMALGSDIWLINRLSTGD